MQLKELEIDWPSSPSMPNLVGHSRPSFRKRCQEGQMGGGGGGGGGCSKVCERKRTCPPCMEAAPKLNIIFCI